MPVFETVKVAAIQAAPVILDADATIDKALGLLHRAADDGVQLAVFPETFVSVYPSGAWGHQAAQFGGFDEMWERLWASSIEVPGPAVDKLVAACAERDILCAIGINEREIERPGSLYNSMLLLGPDGLLIKHRKLVPTMHERLFHGPGDGTDLDVAKTKLGRIGGLICWENRMPLARYELYSKGVQIWVAPTADDSDGWLASMRHIAIESGAFVISVPQYIDRTAFPADFPVPLPDDQVFGRGGAAIIEPRGGEVIAGPLYDEEGIVTATIDLNVGLHAKRWFDVVGHYKRIDAGDPQPGAPGGGWPTSPISDPLQ
ncbi:MAG: nitrilase [Actinomycetota bacterium]|jgi:nitrilase|nr:nitrilase [Actinomycetota bacterium]